MPDLIEDSQIPIPASAFNLWKNIVLDEVYEQNVASQRYVIGKERRMLIAFQIYSDMLWILLFDTTLKLNKWIFLKNQLQCAI